MNRRDTVLALFALGAPLPLMAQPAKIPTIGVLTMGTMTEPMREAFRSGMRERGYVEGRNILIEWRATEDVASLNERASALARELVRMNVSIIVASGTPAVLAAKSATGTIPIVMAPAGDPVASGFVASLGRPGGNITGITNLIAELGPKLLELIREIRPTVSRVAYLSDPANPVARATLEKLESVAGSVGVRIQPVVAPTPGDLEGAFAAMTRERAEAVIIQPILASKRVADLALKHRLLSVTTGIASHFPELGGLLSYGENSASSYRHAAIYVDKILKGARPADLPVEQPTKFELVVNRRTAQALGVAVPHAMLLRADRIIEKQVR